MNITQVNFSLPSANRNDIFRSFNLLTTKIDAPLQGCRIESSHAFVSELVYEPHLKCGARKGLRVRIPPKAIFQIILLFDNRFLLIRLISSLARNRQSKNTCLLEN